MSSASSAARRSLSQRSIRVLVSPAPVTFAERRSILQVLEQYGPVEVFKMTPGYHANFVSVTREAATASKLISCSPLTYDVPEPPVNADIHIADLAELESFDGNVSARASGWRRSTLPAESGLPRDKRQFKLEIFPEPGYKHQFAMFGSPLQKPWPQDYVRDKSMLSGTLRLSLPHTMAATGLAHWLLDSNDDAGMPKADRKEERLQLKQWLPSKMKD